jgi:dihydrolipoamide dehydrogenase
MSAAFDLVVIGSGPGGYVAAAQGASLGLKTAIVEKDALLGGTCLHRGCIPTKALLHAADTYSEVREASKIGINVEGVRVDWSAIQKYKQRIVSTNAGGVSHLMKSRKVEVISGFGKLLGPNKVGVKGADGKTTELDAKNIILAVGSTPRALPFAPFNHPRVLSSDTVLELDHIPGSITIIGGGVIGIESLRFLCALAAK